MGTKVKANPVITKIMAGCIKKILEEILAPKQPRHKDSPIKSADI
jgi:hypothetical protein